MRSRIYFENTLKFLIQNHTNMKTIILSAMFTACCGLFSNNGFAQKEPSQNSKNEEIIIRKNAHDPQKNDH